MKKTKRQYSKDFKDKAVSLSYQRANISELAQELDVSVARIYKWRSQYRDNDTEIKVTSTQQTPETTEVKQIKKELKNARLELEILKKAIHIFSKRDGNITNL